MFCQAGGVLTPNFADVRSPLVAQLRGRGPEGRFDVHVVDECPDTPSARDMPGLVAMDHVARVAVRERERELRDDACDARLGQCPLRDA